MTQFLPPNLLALFAPRDPVPYLPAVDKLTHEKKRQPYTGVADYLDYFEDPEETPPPVRIETKAERLERKRREKAEQAAYKLEQDLALWDANSNPDATTNPYKTLFVARINYDTSESKLRREFEAYGKIKQIKIVHDVNTGKPRGYAFIEYEEESDMHAAYKRADGKKIDGRRVTVDIERGRTIEGWKPRRLGGGKGGTRRMPITQDTPIEDVADIKINNNRDRERERDRDRERDRERKRSRDKRSRSRSPVKRRRSRSKDRHRSKSRDRLKKSRRSRSRDRVERPNQKRVRSRSRDNRMNRNNDEYSNRNNGTNESSMGYNNNNDDGDYENY